MLAIHSDIEFANDEVIVVHLPRSREIREHYVTHYFYVKSSTGFLYSPLVKHRQSRLRPVPRGVQNRRSGSVTRRWRTSGRAVRAARASVSQKTRSRADLRETRKPCPSRSRHRIVGWAPRRVRRVRCDSRKRSHNALPKPRRHQRRFSVPRVAGGPYANPERSSAKISFRDTASACPLSDERRSTVTDQQSSMTSIGNWTISHTNTECSPVVRRQLNRGAMPWNSVDRHWRALENVILRAIANNIEIEPCWRRWFCFCFLKVGSRL